MSLPPVPNTQIQSNNIWLAWFNQIRVLINRFVRLFTVDTSNNITVPANFSVPGTFRVTSPEGNVFISGTPSVSSVAPGIRFHFSTGTGVAVIDCNYNVVFRTGLGANIFAIVPSRTCVALQGRVGTPAGVADGDFWYDSAAGKFRGRAAGVTVDFH